MCASQVIVHTQLTCTRRPDIHQRSLVQRRTTPTDDGDDGGSTATFYLLNRQPVLVKLPKTRQTARFVLALIAHPRCRAALGPHTPSVASSPPLPRALRCSVRTLVLQVKRVPRNSAVGALHGSYLLYRAPSLSRDPRSSRTLRHPDARPPLPRTVRCRVPSLSTSQTTRSE